MRKRLGKTGDEPSTAPALIPESGGEPVLARKNRAAAELGRRGGKKGGAIRAARMTPEDRRLSAQRAAAARWAKPLPEPAGATGDPNKGEHGMAREPKPFVFTLSFEEASEITGASGSGGHQELHRRLTQELERGDNQVTFTDEQLGELIRYMIQYGSGGFQGRLRRAFSRSLADLLGFRVVA